MPLRPRPRNNVLRLQFGQRVDVRAARTTALVEPDKPGGHRAERSKCAAQISEVAPGLDLERGLLSIARRARPIAGISPMHEPVALGCQVEVTLGGHRQGLNPGPNERGIATEQVLRPTVDTIV